MRQVDNDELTYQIFSGLRGWTASVRAGVFAPAHRRHPFARSVAADKVCGKLTSWDFIDPAKPAEPIALKQVSTLFEGAIGSFPGAISKLWMSGQRDREREAHTAAAILLAGALDGLEVLSPTSILHLGLQRLSFPQLQAPDHAFRANWP